MRSFPVPVSPRSSTGASVAATCSTWARTRESAGLVPTISSKPRAWRTSSRSATFSASSRSFSSVTSRRLASSAAFVSSSSVTSVCTSTTPSPVVRSEAVTT